MVLHTIGYEKLNPIEFLAWMRKFNINVVADVRENPNSRKKGFSKKSLEEMLNEIDIRYEGFQELGTPKEMRDHLISTGDYKNFFSQYRSMLKDKGDYIEKIRDFMESGNNVALLCYERDVNTCHRLVLADEIKKRDGNGLVINHITPLKQ